MTLAHDHEKLFCSLGVLYVHGCYPRRAPPRSSLFPERLDDAIVAEHPVRFLAVLEEGVVIAINAVVHIATRCLAGTGVPIGHIAFGDPATVYAPHDAPTVHAQLAALGFTKAVFGLDAQRLADADTIEQLCARYAKALS